MGDMNNSRMGFLGASDFGPLLGLSRFKTPHQLWLEKTGQAEPEPENFNQELGKLLEDDVLELFYRRTGARPVQTTPIQHPTKPWLVVQIDRLAMLADELVVVEAKTAAIKRDDGWGRNGSADVPGAYYAQVQVQCFVQRARAHREQSALVSRAFVPCLFFNGKTFNIFEVPYDHDMATQLVAKGEEFWDRVVTRAWPEEMAA